MDASDVLRRRPWDALDETKLRGDDDRLQP